MGAAEDVEAMSVDVVVWSLAGTETEEVRSSAVEVLSLASTKDVEEVEVID